MKNSFLCIATGLFLLLFGVTIHAQNSDDPVLMSIAGSPVTKSEFLNIYQKNNVKGEVIDKKSLDEYVELFINFKLKVKEAEELGMDTITSFITELSGYRKQLAQKYMIDEEVDEKLLQEAYERMQYDVRASHILIKCEPGASPADSLAAFTKISALRGRILKGEGFGALASEQSDDLSARDREGASNRAPMKGNGGDLGYFTVFDMVYPFETAAYKTKVGEVSQPIRTEYGYHLIKVTDKRKAMGRAHAAHIFISLQQKLTAEDSLEARNKIFDIQSKLKAGVDWDSLAQQYSEDKGTAPKGGVLPWFGVNRMVPEFIQEVATLSKPGDISRPITTPFGWHIIKLLEKKEIGSFEEVKADIKQKVSRDSRSQLSKEAMVEKIKLQYGFKEFVPARAAILPLLDSSLFQGNWDTEKTAKMKEPVFSLGDKNYSQHELALFLNKENKNKSPEDFNILLSKSYKKFVEESCLAYKDSKLESEFPEFRNLMKEYRDGILLFDLTDKKVWSKAVKDTTGLEEYYLQNKTNYQWGERVKATVFQGKDKAQVEKVHKMVGKQMKSGKLDTAAVFKKFNKKGEIAIQAEEGKFSRGDNKWIDETDWNPGVHALVTDQSQWFFVVITQKLGPEVKTLNEARGLITADYQNFLEKDWIKTLRQKYSIQVNKDVLSTIQ